MLSRTPSIEVHDPAADGPGFDLALIHHVPEELGMLAHHLADYIIASVIGTQLNWEFQRNL